MDDIIRLPESKTLEFKRDFSSPEGVFKSLIAFANTAGGRLIIGVSDKTKQVIGVTEPLLLESRLTSMISDYIAPQLIPNIEVLPYRHLYLVSIEVYPSNSKPHYLKGKGREGGSYVRVGSSNRLADAATLQELERYARLETYDAAPMPRLTIDNLDVEAALTAFSPYRKLKKTDLETLKLMVRHQGKLVPSVGGMLLFGKNRLQHFPDAWIQVGRFNGVDKTHILDSEEITDIPVNAVLKAISFVEKHSMRSFVIERDRRQEKVNIPMVAIREAIINAVVHADYALSGSPIRVSIFDDRVEIMNPGHIPIGLTLDDIMKGVSKLRNPVIGRVFYELKLVEHWGSGIGRMIDACRRQGFAAPLLEEVGNGFRVTLSVGEGRQSTYQGELDERDQFIMKLLKAHDGMTTSAVADKIGISARAARTRLLKLINSGLIVEVGMSVNDPRKVYRVVE